EHIRLWNKVDVAGSTILVSPGAPDYRFQRVADEHSTPHEFGVDGYVLEPGRFILAWTHERVELPVENGLAARVEGKSSVARLGIGIHVTAPTIHAGFRGEIQLEMFNFGALNVRLVPGMRVCQLIFEQSLGTPEKAYAGMFANQAAV